MSANLDRICTVDISLSSPISNNDNFNSVLILGPAAAAPKGNIPAVGVYKSLEELTELGFAATGATADPIGVAARVAFSQTPRPSEVYVAYIGEVTDDGEDEPRKQTVKEVLAEAIGTDGWYCICPVGLSKDDVLQVIQWTETQNKICGYIDDDPEHPIVETGLYLRSFPIFPKVTEDQLENDVPAENKYGAAIAMAVKAMNFHAGKETWALKQVAAVTPSKLSSTFIKKLEAANISYVINVASKNVTQGGNTYYIRPLPAFRAANLSAELAALIAPLISGLAPLVASVDTTKEGKGLFDVDVSEAAPAITGAFSSLSGDKLEAILRHLLVTGGNIAVETPEEEKPKKLTEDLVNELFCTDVQDMFILAFEVIRTNYGGFFEKLGGQFGQAVKDLMKTATPRQENTATST